MGEAHASWSRHRKRCLRGRRTESLFIELDRSFQTDAWAKPTRPGVGTASGASVAAEENLYSLSSTGHFRRTRGRSPRVLESAPQAVPPWPPKRISSIELDRSFQTDTLGES